MKNFGAPAPGTKLWEPTAEEVAAIKAGGNITRAARWDSATPEQRELIHPELNPNKRWFEQKAYEIVAL